MAVKGTGDWTAGMIAIFAALMIGGAVPALVYFGLYQPKVEERTGAERRLDDLKVEQDIVLAKQAEVRGLMNDASDMAKRLEQSGENFVTPPEGDTDVPELRRFLRDQARIHGLALLPRHTGQIGAEMIYWGDRVITFEHGLQATQIIAELYGTYHDFGRYLAFLESLPEVMIIDTLRCEGDSNGGRMHSFELRIYVVLKRDIEQIGS
jgi:Tfp pilus assembly protein PilO